MDCGPQVVPTSALWGPARGPGQIGPAGAFNQRSIYNKQVERTIQH